MIFNIKSNIENIIMGIDGIHPLIKDAGAISATKLSAFKGYRIAIDFMAWLYRATHTAHKVTSRTRNVVYDNNSDEYVIPVIIRRWIGFLKTLMSFGITPIVVLEGKANASKSATVKERKEKRDDIKEEHKTLRESLQKAGEIPLNEKSEATKLKLIDDHKRLVKLDANMASPDKEIINAVIEVTDYLGIPILKAVGEGEQLCCMLAIDGTAAAVYSNDSDCLPLGCPIMIKDITLIDSNIDINEMSETNEVSNENETSKINKVSKPSKELCAVTIELKDVLNAFDIEFEQLQEICILAGCDHNEGIKGIAAKTALKYIKDMTLEQFCEFHPEELKVKHERKKAKSKSVAKSGAIPDLVLPDYKSSLNIDVCRKVFEYKSSKTLIDTTFRDIRYDVVPTDIDILTETLKKYGVDKLTKMITDVLSALDKPKSFPTSRPPNIR